MLQVSKEFINWELLYFNFTSFGLFSFYAFQVAVDSIFVSGIDSRLRLLLFILLLLLQNKVGIHLIIVILFRGTLKKITRRTTGARGYKFKLFKSIV